MVSVLPSIRLSAFEAVVAEGILKVVVVAVEKVVLVVDKGLMVDIFGNRALANMGISS